MASELRVARHRWGPRLAVFAIVFCLGGPAGPWASDDDSPASMSVRVYPYVSPEPATVLLRIQVIPHDANRHLTVEVDSPLQFRSSLISLDGSFAPTLHWLTLESLPAGEYVVTARLDRLDEPSVVISDSFIVA